ncbi:cyd operon protein YbgT [Burkholderia oklahomensis]|uniref:Cyd operon protein YbgT n=2 Tax=Burkholderia oklahomensis TaxID=342113 RepID=A0AAI8FMX2_9BURK|nr:cyd operon protein YbgT [Burkholderia oklahomensis]
MIGIVHASPPARAGGAPSNRPAARAAGLSVKEAAMWYFSWILGIGVALGFGIINAMWLEANGTLPADASDDKSRADRPAVSEGGRS